MCHISHKFRFDAFKVFIVSLGLHAVQATQLLRPNCLLEVRRKSSCRKLGPCFPQPQCYKHGSSISFKMGLTVEWEKLSVLASSYTFISESCTFKISCFISKMSDFLDCFHSLVLIASHSFTFQTLRVAKKLQRQNKNLKISKIFVTL
jgi:hypothetical protein